MASSCISHLSLAELPVVQWCLLIDQFIDLIYLAVMTAMEPSQPLRADAKTFLNCTWNVKTLSVMFNNVNEWQKMHSSRRAHEVLECGVLTMDTSASKGMKFSQVKRETMAASQ